MEINKIYCGDNLELLKSIPDNQVDLIYSDILYGTGRNFGDYQDLPTNRIAIERHYLPRLKEMWRVLKYTGTIYLQMDTNINHWIRCLMDEIFECGNFRNEIIWSYNSAPRKKKDFGKRHDIIYRYTKTGNYTFNPPREAYSLSAPRGYEKEKYYHAEGKVVGDVWDIKILGQNDKTERVGYATQKPLELAARIITASSNPSDLVADFYCGSGTTCVAAKNMGRNYIGVDINQNAVDISNKRLND